jgi:hypothetical protein
MCIESPNSPVDKHAIVGDFAHIYPHSPAGPRHQASPPSRLDLNSYENWILLCATHHRLVDAQPGTHDVAFLINAKRDHERWVESRLGAPDITKRLPVRELRQVQLYRVASAKLPPWQPRPAGVGPSLGRWDDPYGQFSVLYASLTAEAAVAETLAPFRGSPELASRDPSGPGDVSRDWFKDRLLATGELRAARVVDLTRNLTEVLVALGMPADTAGLSVDRRLTQSLAHTAFQFVNNAGHPLFDGILYTGRATGAELVALFNDRVEVAAVKEVPLSRLPHS